MIRLTTWGIILVTWLITRCDAACPTIYKWKEVWETVDPILEYRDKIHPPETAEMGFSISKRPELTCTSYFNCIAKVKGRNSMYLRYNNFMIFITSGRPAIFELPLGVDVMDKYKKVNVDIIFPLSAHEKMHSAERVWTSLILSELIECLVDRYMLPKKYTLSFRNGGEIMCYHTECQNGTLINTIQSLVRLE